MFNKIFSKVNQKQSCDQSASFYRKWISPESDN